MKIVFATNNRHKLREIQQVLEQKISILSLEDINCFEDIPEDKDTIAENALQKAWYVKKKFNVNCFADDTGLEIEGLNGKPGVYSARYAGLQRDSEDNMNKVLTEMKGITNRKARFLTVIALVLNGKEFLFEGEIKGKITHKKMGDSGFGYDPIFLPEGYELTFAQMSAEQKNTISHRAIAVNKLVNFLIEKS